MKTYKQRLVIQKAFQHEYMMLNRYQTDLDYYFGYGNRCENHLYFHSFVEHISETIKLWKKLPFKPSWLRATQLIEYKTKGINIE